MKKTKIWVCLLVCSFIFSNCMTFTYAEGTDTSSAPISEEKVYSNATIEDDFYEDSIIVVLSNETSLKFKDYSSNDFSEVACDQVLDLTIDKKEKMKESIFNDASSFSLQKNDAHRAVDKYNQILCIKLKSKGKNEVLSAINILSSRSDIIYVGPNYKINSCSTSSNQTILDQWAHDTIQLPQAWNIEIGSNDVVVGVIDSGIDSNHIYLQNSIITSLCRDYTLSDPVIQSVTDAHGHGTQIAGIIGANDVDNIGVSGICKNVRLVSLRVLDENGEGQLSNAINAINYAEAQGFPIINYSIITELETEESSYVLYQAIENYSGLFVCAAGNYGYDNDTKNMIPANYQLSNLITVAASDESDQRAIWNSDESSCFGKNTVDIFAPGVQIRTTTPGNAFLLANGTSMAAPHVSGVAALILSKYPNLNPSETKHIILSNTDECNDAFTNLCTSGGRLNAFKTLSSTFISHSYEYSYQNGSISHTATCTICNYAYTEVHILLTKRYSAKKHLRYCSKCDFNFYENHTYDLGQTKCTVCGFTVEGSLWSLKRTGQEITYQSKQSSIE